MTRKTFTLWMHRDGLGWWLEEEGYDDAADACGRLAELLAEGHWTGGAVVPAGAFPAPVCDECLKAGRTRRREEARRGA